MIVHLSIKVFSQSSNWILLIDHFFGMKMLIFIFIPIYIRDSVNITVYGIEMHSIYEFPMRKGIYYYIATNKMSHFKFKLYFIDYCVNSNNHISVQLNIWTSEMIFTVCFLVFLFFFKFQIIEMKYLFISQ